MIKAVYFGIIVLYVIRLDESNPPVVGGFVNLLLFTIFKLEESKMRKFIPSIISLCLVLTGACFAAVPEPAGLWEFNSLTNLTRATIGNDLELVGSHLSIEGVSSGDKAVSIGIGSYYICTSGITPNGGGGYVNEYTLLYDLSYPTSTLGQWASILQTNQMNENDGDYFKHPSDESWGVADLGYSDNRQRGEFYSEADTWYRIVLSVKLAMDGTEFFNLYVDGELACTHDTGWLGTDGRFSIENTVLFFADDDTEDAELHISNLAIWDHPLTEEEIAELGIAGTPFASFGATNPIPADGQTVSTDWDLLSWQLPEPNYPGNIVTCDVYFTDYYPEYGKYSDDPNFSNYADKIVDNEAVESITLSSVEIELGVYQTYYWRVDCYEADDLTIGVVWMFNTNNAAPDVDAGADIRTWLEGGSTTVNIDASVSDDGLPDPPAEYSMLWSLADGNDLYVTIHSPETEDTDVTITETGAYVFELQADDSEAVGSDTVTISVYNDPCESAKADPEFELLVGDFDEDCDVDMDDFAAFAANWMMCNRDDCL